MPEQAQACIASWRTHMPEYELRLWTEENFDIDLYPYAREAYDKGMYAFVSDVARLWALEQFGGVYMDVDMMAYRPLDELLRYAAFAGYEGSKRQPVMMGVLASEPHGAWVRDMLSTYATRRFILPDGSCDMTPNTSYFTQRLLSQGFVADGVEKDVYVEGVFYVHVLPVWAFCPILTTGEDVRTVATYCEAMGESSWASDKKWKTRVLSMFSPAMRTRLIKIKRKWLG